MTRSDTGIGRAAPRLAIPRRAALQLLASPLVVPSRPAAGTMLEDGWTSLFNGRDLAGWDTFLGRPHASTEMPGVARKADGTYADVVGVNRDPRGVFSVVREDDAPAIRISGETYGALISRAEYEDYHLRLQFKWGTRRWPPRPEQPRDTGCCYHSVGPLGASYGFWMRSFEFQIQEGDVGDFYSLAGVMVDVTAVAADPSNPKSDLVYAPTAPRGTGNTRRVVKAANVERPHGRWNTLDLYCLRDTSVHVVNGTRQVVLTRLRQPVEGGAEAPLTRGRLQLQSEAAEVFFRRLAVRPLARLPAGLLA